MYRFKMITRSMLLLVVAFLVVLAGRSAQAVPTAVFDLTVDTPTDSLINSGCDDGVDDDDCSLRGAITYANNTAAGSTIYITIPTDTYTLTLTGPGEDANTTGDFDIIGRSIYLTGVGPSKPILDGASSDRVLDNHGGTLFINHLEIAHGSVTTSGGGGGGIKNRYGSSLFMDSVTIEYNTVNGTTNEDVGGGVVTESPLSISNSIISSNTAYIGGGLYNSYSSDHFTLTNVFVAGNNATYGGGLAYYGDTVGNIIDSSFYSNTGGEGGGIYNYGDLILNRVTIYNNHSPAAGNFGGGIENWANLTLLNVTLTGNNAYSAGGFHAVNGSSASFNHCTIVDNTSTHYGQDVYLGFGSTNSFHNTIVSRSIPGDTTCFMDDIRVTITDLGYNLSSDHSCGFSTSAPYYDQIDVTPALVLLAFGYYGGLTDTIALVAHGPAVDTADPNTSLTRDQRGYFRPMFGRSDIGSFEWDSVQLNRFFWLPFIKATHDV